MKSARVQGIFQRVCGRCEQIYANMRHFPSELARSKRSFHCAISPARHDTVNVRQSVGFVFQAKMRVVPRKFMFFRPNSPKENWDIFV